MSHETLFSIASALVLPAWALLALSPRWKWTRTIVFATPVVLGVFYLYLIATYWGTGGGGYGSLASVQKLFDVPGLLLAGWLHYLAFDLFVGAWEARDAHRNGIPHFFVIPCLGATLLFGPVGLLLYLALRAALRRRFTFEETP